MKKLGAVIALMTLIACGGGDSEGGGRPGGGRGGGGGGRPPWAGGQQAAAAVPVEVATVERKTIASFIETNGSLEAENEVDIVARLSAPIVGLLVEEGDYVQQGQTLARLDDTELAVQTEIARVQVAETKQAYERAVSLMKDDLIAPEEHERAVSAYDSAKANLKAAEIQLEYTTIRAPFSGRVIRRYVDRAEQVSANTALYRLSDFTPLLCPIQVPERDLSRLRIGQPATLRVEAYPDETFEAQVLRISPIIEAETGTVKVTLEAKADRRLRPGMFARVFVEAERRESTLVIPKAALSLESIGDTVYVAQEGAASRREVTIGFRQADEVEILNGVSEGEQIVVVGQDGLSDGTPLQILAGGDGSGAAPQMAAAEGEGAPAEGAPGGRPAGKRPDMSNMSEEQIKERMRARGMNDEQIEKMLAKRRSGQRSKAAE